MLEGNLFDQYCSHIICFYQVLAVGYEIVCQSCTLRTTTGSRRISVHIHKLFEYSFFVSETTDLIIKDIETSSFCMFLCVFNTVKIL